MYSIYVIFIVDLLFVNYKFLLLCFIALFRNSMNSNKFNIYYIYKILLYFKSIFLKNI